MTSGWIILFLVLGAIVGAILAAAVMWQQVQILRREILFLQSTISIDALTGLKSQVALREEADRILSRALYQNKREKAPGVSRVAVIILDLDSFKWVNDTHGHLTGNDLLREFADLLTSHFRVGRDTLARWGGDEFVLLLPGLDDRDVARRMWELEGAFTSLLPEEFRAHGVGFTWGHFIATQPIGFEDAFGRADNILNIRKAAKRGNRRL
jgi:diguanylate cyclase (GGDEF)-like protein